MGETRVAVRVYGPGGSVELDVLVDTGATFTKISESTAEELALKAEEMISVRLSDGSQRTRGLTAAEVELDGVRRSIPVAIGPDEEEPLLGYTALEILGFKVDPVSRRLERTLPIEY